MAINFKFTDIGDLYPKADTIEKAIGFISCAAKQGRTEVRMRAPGAVSAELYNLGFETSKFGYPDGDIGEFTVAWNM